MSRSSSPPVSSPSPTGSKLPGVRGRGGQPPGGHRDGHRADEQVDQEHPAPPVAGPGGGDDQAAEQRPDRGGDPDHGAQQAECPGPCGPGEGVLDRRADRREEQPRAQALNDPRGDELALVLRDSAAHAGQGEDGQPGQEEPLGPEPVPGPAARHQGQAVGQGIAGDDPFQAGR
jgi:hypothetical protein